MRVTMVALGSMGDAVPVVVVASRLVTMWREAHPGVGLTVDVCVGTICRLRRVTTWPFVTWRLSLFVQPALSHRKCALCYLHALPMSFL